MLSTLLSLILFLAPQENPAPPTKQRIAESVQELKQALRRGTQEQAIKLLTGASAVPSKEVAKLLFKNLKNKDPELVDAALLGLRWMQHPDALSALHKAYASHKDLRHDDQVHLKLIKSIGQHGDPSSIKLLSHDLFASKKKKLVQARIFGMGMIRNKSSIKALFKQMTGSIPKRVDDHMISLRPCLIILTGIDRGPKQAPWLKWWRENEKGFKMAPLSPNVPVQTLAKWQRYWGLERTRPRATKREDRGL